MYRTLLFIPLLFVGMSLANSLQINIPEDYLERVIVDVPELIPLRDQADAGLQARLENAINANPVWRQLVRNKRMAISLVDMSDTKGASLAHLNGDHMMYAASLPKIAVLLAAMDAIEKGELQETPNVAHDMRIMISRSNNAATTRMIDRLGFAKIADVMTDPAYKLYDPAQGGGLWVGKRYGSGGGRHPDPMKGISHAATANQVNRYYYLMANGQLVTPERSSQMMEVMVDPELHHKFVNTLDRVAPGAQIYRKSGSWRNYHSDSAMVVDGERNYIVTALIEDANGETICRELIYAVEQVLAQ